MSRDSSNSQYQIRINGRPVLWADMMHDVFIEQFAKHCHENPASYVDIVHVNTEIIMSQQIYGIMEKHFKVDFK